MGFSSSARRTVAAKRLPSSSSVSPFFRLVSRRRKLYLLVMGSQAMRMAYTSKWRSLFYTDGWIDTELNIVDEYYDMVEPSTVRYDDTCSPEIGSLWLRATSHLPVLRRYLHGQLLSLSGLLQVRILRFKNSKYLWENR